MTDSNHNPSGGGCVPNSDDSQQARANPPGIILYTMPNCPKCVAARDKLDVLGVAYTEEQLPYYLTQHEGWRSDGSADIRSAHDCLGGAPLFRVDVGGTEAGDDLILDDPAAMKLLKALRRAKG